MRRFLLLFFLLLAFPALAPAEETIAFRHFSTSDGLVSNQINVLYRDSKGILWVGTSSGVDRYDAYRFSHFSQEDGLPGLYVIHITEDTLGQIWVRTSEGTACYSYQEGRFLSTEEGMRKMGIKVSAPSVFGGDRDHRYFWAAEGRVLWVYSSFLKRVFTFPIAAGDNLASCYLDGLLYYLDVEGNLHRANLRTGQTEDLDFPREYRPELTPFLPHLVADRKGDVWFYTGQAYRLVRRTPDGHWQEFPLPRRHVPSGGIAKVSTDSSGNLWVAGSHSGLMLIRPDGSIRTFTHNPDQYFSLPGDRLSALHIDQEDNVWVGSTKMGLSVYSPWSQAPLYYQIPGADDILSICENSNGIFLGTNGLGLWMSERYDGEYHRVPDTPEIVNCILRDRKEQLWLGSWGENLVCLDAYGRKKAEYGLADGLLARSIMILREGTDGAIYIGHYQGIVQRLDPVTGHITTCYENRNFNLRDLVFLDEHTMVVAVSNGLVTMDPCTGELKDGPVLPDGVNATALFIDHGGFLWIAGRKGVWCWNPSTKALDTLKGVDGRRFPSAMGVTEDLVGRIWISSTRGMMLADRNEDEYFMQSYGSMSGTGLSEFNPRSILTLHHGEVLAGTSKGVAVIHPRSGYSRDFDAKIYLTSMDYAGEDYAEHSRIPLLEESEMVITNSMLPLSLYFSCLNYDSPETITYQYKIKGFSDRWTTLSGNGVRFSVLPPGKYELSVRACNDQHIWSPHIRTLTLIVRPQWYRSRLAYSLYLCVILLAMFWLMRIITRRRELAEALERMNKEAEDQKKLLDMKLTFFAGVSHELRTPLSLIINPLDEFVKRYPQYRAGYLETARSNAAYLKELIDQLLSFRKMDAGGEKMQYTHRDVISVLKDVFVSFQSIAERRKITFAFQSSETTLEMDFDRDKISKILRNLLSNAFKYTPDGGAISVAADRKGKWFILSVSDTGPGIPPAERPSVFKMFYQSDAPSQVLGGSGIGLYLVDQYVQMHGGNVSITDNTPSGAVFTLQIPLETAVPSVSVDSPLRSPDIPLPEKVNHLPQHSILLVDDNAEFLDFLSRSLSSDYRVLCANEGLKALEILRCQEVDLVVSDVMMPNMDGMELCRAIKADARMSHIPVILLTAKSGEEFQLEGLRQGADDYVTKPFNMEILQSRIERLIAIQENRQAIPAGEMPVQPSRADVTPLDRQFVEKAIRVVEDQLGNVDFSVEDLASGMNISRGYLYRKITAITGKSAIEFIRTIRMKRAQQLLAESQLQIAEVAYQLGYHSPKTFAKHFRQVFGLSPSEYVRSWKEPEGN